MKAARAKTVAAPAKRKAVQLSAPKRQRAVWTGVKRKSGVSPLQLHLPGLGGVIQ
jgi:hypothetical protein